MADVDIRVEGRVGCITLNRPDALNALDELMMRMIDSNLRRWAEDDAVLMVVIDAAGDRAFCAGGDIAALYRRTQGGDLAFGRAFWRDEYRMNARIKNYQKPYVALMDGITMGGGVGLSAHGSHRIVTERSMIAMPECAIGLIPDVGGTFLLSRAPGHLGEFLGLTGTRMGPADAILAGFADFFVPAAKIPDLTEALVKEADPRVIEQFADVPPAGELEAQRAAIDKIFDADDPRTIVDLLGRTTDRAWHEKVTQALARASPLALHCSLRMIREARAMETLEEALAAEYRFTWRSLEQGEFMEGIRAAVIDKDRAPRWTRPKIDDVGRADVQAMLESLGDNELTF